jgi:hypothetical protein
MQKTCNIVTSILLAGAFLAGCSSEVSNNTNSGSTSQNGLRPMTADERAQDFDAMVIGFRDNYAPLQYKEKRFGFKFDDLVAQYRPMILAATSDAEAMGVMKQFATRFQDGHVSIMGNIQKMDRYVVPMVITPVEDKFLLTSFLEEGYSRQTGLQIGDEVVEVDGKAPADYLPTILKYESLANPVSNRYMIARLFSRPLYITELIPQKPNVVVKVVKPNGTVMERSLIWKMTPSPNYVPDNVVMGGPLRVAYAPAAQELIHADIKQMGSETPFFMTPGLEEAFKLVRVAPSEKYLKKYGLNDTTKTPKLYAALYRFDGKNILLIRQADYMVPDADARIIWYKAILDEYGSLADALVVDQTHNPGGRLDYALNFVSLFANQTTRSLVNFLHADRRWLTTLTKEEPGYTPAPAEKRMNEVAYKLVEDAYDKGLPLTETPVAFGDSDFLTPANFTFKKPVLMLTDELAGSCGDVVPTLMKANKLATLFGERTMGLGGNVEEVALLPNSQMVLRATRGFFIPFSPEGTYDLENPVENNGVTPDVRYTHTVQDVRAGYVGYFSAFSKAAAGLVK